MAYGLHPQLYPYLYAPKNPLTLSSAYDHSEPSHTPRHKSSKEREETLDKLSHDEASSKGDDECPMDENENVEID